MLDTHIWIWHANGSDRLTREERQRLRAQESEGLGVSVISCWEVAKLVEYDRLELTMSVGEWVEQALRLPGLRLLGLTPEIAVASAQLPGAFHRGPADQMIVATARQYDLALMTNDRKILAYEHVHTL